MTRRAFLAALGAVAVAPVAARAPAPPVASGLTFHPNAFAMAYPMPKRVDVLYGAGVVRDPKTGISMRFVDRFEKGHS